MSIKEIAKFSSYKIDKCYNVIFTFSDTTFSIRPFQTSKILSMVVCKLVQQSFDTMLLVCSLFVVSLLVMIIAQCFIQQQKERSCV